MSPRVILEIRYLTRNVNIHVKAYKCALPGKATTWKQWQGHRDLRAAVISQTWDRSSPGVGRQWLQRKT